ncbi:MAG: FHA domain-containing protein [Planctomycetes bacterium]|nr:FHA domain-containing protein [Planctomycetota bacterium]
MAFMKKKPAEDPKGNPPPKSDALEEVEPIEELEELEEVEPIEEPNALEPLDLEEVVEKSRSLEKDTGVKENTGTKEVDDEDEEEDVLPSSALELAQDDDEEDEEKSAKAEKVAKMEAPAEPEKPAAYMAVIDAEGNETIFALDRAVTIFGRDEKSTVVIPDRKASRKHFVIEMAGDFYNIIDSGSTNGTKVNGKKISTHRLREGDTVNLGQYKIVYHGPSDEPSKPVVKPAKPSSSGEDFELPEEPPAPKEKATPQMPLADDAVTCAECGKEMPDNAPCECGYKSLKLRAQEHFVDTIARGESILGGIGLWKLKRQKALDKAFALEDVEWVLEKVCEGCGKRHRVMNEFRIQCVKCECGGEVRFSADDPPKLD